MFGMIGKIICIVLSVACFGYSGVCLFTNTDKTVDSYVEVTDYNVHPENEGKLVMMKGKLTYNGEPVVDPDTGVKLKAPLLQRNTQMFQYIPSGTEKYRTSTTGWEKNAVPTFTDKYDRKHINPSFPSDVPKSKDFAVDLTMENGNLKIDGEFVKALSYKQYVTFKDHYDRNLVNVVKLPSGRIPSGFKNMGTSYYRFHNSSDNSIFDVLTLTKKAKNSKVGDIRIAYKAFKWDNNLPEFTIIGVQQNGKLMKKDGSLFYDYRIDGDKELKREVRKNNRSAMFGAGVCGVILAVIALFI